jgi:hypothetical protein
MSAVGAVAERCGPGASPPHASQAARQHATKPARSDDLHDDHLTGELIPEGKCEPRAGSTSLHLPHTETGPGDLDGPGGVLRR